MVDVQPRIISRHRAALGEGPLWDHRCERLIWCDILARSLHVLEGSAERTLKFEHGITAIALARGGGYVATGERRFMLLDADFAQVWESEEVEPREPGNRFNDGKVDLKGRFWAGTMQREAKGNAGSFYRLAGGGYGALSSGFGCTNGPAFSPDGDTVYFTDSNARAIYRANLGEPLRRDHPFIQFAEKDGAPDGMTVDAQGRLYVAHFGGSAITRYSPDGIQDARFEMPVRNITSVTFGGPDFATLYVTSAHCTFPTVELIQRPAEGATFALDVGARGLPANEFVPSKEQTQ